MHNYVGFDANQYPGDALLPALRKQFSFTGYWLTNPPLSSSNSWLGKRDILLRQGFGFLVVADGRWDKEIVQSQRSGTPPAALGRRDAAVAIAAAHREGFPPHTIIFLDQEEGGRMLPEQAEYLLTWTETIAASPYRPGVYASGQLVKDGTGPGGNPVTITTIQDLRQQIAAKHLHPIAFWVIQDACPPAPGCVVEPAAKTDLNLSGTIDATAWQYAQSPRHSCRKGPAASTYASNGNCYAPGLSQYSLDLSLSRSPDPSHGR
ncbi:MAG TPA: glycoside hydrolase domain-containing protein [Acidobacteriaceae bacterium]|nr:glycoside hydrolase domain-containing protein [Acidobacteriaceae bacterium]